MKQNKKISKEELYNQVFNEDDEFTNSKIINNEIINKANISTAQTRKARINIMKSDNQIYANGDKFERVSPEEIMVAGVKQRVTQVKSVNDTMIYTREDYKTFIKHLLYRKI